MNSGRLAAHQRILFYSIINNFAVLLLRFISVYIEFLLLLLFNIHCGVGVMMSAWAGIAIEEHGIGELVRVHTHGIGEWVGNTR